MASAQPPRSRWLQALPWLLIPVLAALLLYRPLFLGEAIGPFDSIRGMYEAGAKNEGVFDVLQADGALQFHAWRGLVFEGWGRLDPPFWNPHQLMGTPLMANSQSAALYPPHMILGLLRVPLVLGIGLLAWMHLSLAGLGVMFLARRLRAPMPGAFVAGIGAASSPFLLSWMPLASVPTTAAWMPWLWACAWTIAARPWSLRWVAGLAGSGAMMVLAGHLQFAAYGFVGAGIFGIVGLCRRAPVREIAGRALAGALGLALAFGLAAPQLLPVLEYSQFSHRSTPATAEAFPGYLRGSLAPFELIGVFFPPLMGEPGQPADIEGRSLGLYWPAYARIGADYPEGALVLGPAAIALFAWARRRTLTRGAIAAFCAALVGLLLATGTPLNAALYFGIPGWAATGSPSRALCLAVFAGLPLAALMWPRQEDLSRRGALIAAGACGAAALLAVAGVASGAAIPPSWIEGFPIAAIASQAFLEAAPRVLLAALAAAGGAVLIWRGRSWLAAGSLAAAQILVSGPHLMPVSPQAPQADPAATPLIRQAWINEGWSLLEAAPDAWMPPNLAAVRRLYDAAGYDSLVHRDTAAWLNEVNGANSSPEANGNIFFIKPSADPAKLAESGVTRVASMLEVPAFGPRRIEDGRFIYDLDGPGRFSSSRPFEVLQDRLSSQLIRADGPARLVIRDRMMPGWRAWVGGEEVPLDPAARWREIEVPEGVWSVALRYDPPGLQNGLIAGGASLFLMTIVIFSSKRRKPGAK